MMHLVKRFLIILPVVLVLFALFLGYMHHAVWRYGIDRDYLFGSLFNLNGEHTIASWFASIQWFSVAIAAILAYTLERSLQMKKWCRPWWLVFALVFIVASADESAILHENIGLHIIKPMLEERGLGHSIWGYFVASPWVIFYASPIFAFIGVTLVFLGDRFRENAITMYLCSSGFGCYAAAMIIEFFQGLPFPKMQPIADMCGVTCKIFYTRSIIAEETLENLGTAAVLMAVLLYCYTLLHRFTEPGQDAQNDGASQN